jgi:hypothetical protein
MNLHVAIEALFTEQARVCATRWQAGAAVNIAGVKPADMALLAQPGLSTDQQVRVVRTVSGVAVGAVFLYRRMLPQERPAFLSMAVITLFIDRVAIQVARSGRAVWLVAVCAGQQAGM